MHAKTHLRKAKTAEQIDKFAKEFQILTQQKNIFFGSQYFKEILYRYPDLIEWAIKPDDYKFIVNKLVGTNSERPMVNRDDFNADISELKTVLKKTYSGYGVFRSRGLSWDSFFKKWQIVISKKGAIIPIDEVFEHFDATFSEFIDNHFGYYFSGMKRQDNRSLSIVNKKNVKGFLRARKKILKNNKFTKIQIQYGPAHLAQIEKTKWRHSAEFHAKMISQFGKADDLYIKSFGNCTYLRVPTFTSNVRTQYNKLNFKDKRFMKGPLIVDIRSNAGFSNIDFTEEVIGYLAGVEGTPKYLDYFHIKMRRGKLVEQLANNFGLFTRLMTKTNNEKLDLRPYYKRKIKLMTSSQPEREMQKISKTKVFNKRPVILLVNRFTGSDGEAMLQYLRHWSNVKVVGENTSGSCEFSQPGLYILKRTKIPFFIPRGHKQINLAKLDGFGFPPDLYLDEKAWGRSGILKLIDIYDLF